MSSRRLVAILPLLMALAACGTESTLPASVGFGANPQLPEARSQRIPTVKIAPAVGWPEGRTPVAAQGLAVNAFATGLDHPRWLYELPNGDVLVGREQRSAQARRQEGRPARLDPGAGHGQGRRGRAER